MKLNPELVREILLTVEENTGCNNKLRYTNDDKPSRLRNNSHKEIVYHMR